MNIVGLAVGLDVDPVGAIHGVQPGGGQMGSAKRAEFLLERYRRLPVRIASHLNWHQFFENLGIGRPGENSCNRHR